MKKIGPRDSSQELVVRKIVESLRYKFVLHAKGIPGKPDLVFPRRHKAIFVHGCFWHGHKNCIRSKLPTTNRSFWKSKIQGNIKRDRRVKSELKRLGWKSMTIWQCELGKSKEEQIAKGIQKFLQVRVSDGKT